MKVAILASGGKDSTYSAWWSTLQGWDISCIVTVGVTGQDSMMFQLENTSIAGLQACSMGVPWLPVSSKGVEGMEILDLERAFLGEIDPLEELEMIWPKEFERPEGMAIFSGKLQIDGIVTGALRSDYQKTKLEMMCERLGVRSFSPIWHKSAKSHMSSLVNHGFGVVFTSVSTEGMDERWLGKELDMDSLETLEELSNRYRFNLDGEGGEFETIVVRAPHMKGTIVFDGQNNWEISRGHMKMKKCSLKGHR